MQAVCHLASASAEVTKVEDNVRPLVKRATLHNAAPDFQAAPTHLQKLRNIGHALDPLYGQASINNTSSVSTLSFIILLAPQAGSLDAQRLAVHSDLTQGLRSSLLVAYSFAFSLPNHCLLHLCCTGPEEPYMMEGPGRPLMPLMPPPSAPAAMRSGFGLDGSMQGEGGGRADGGGATLGMANMGMGQDMGYSDGPGPPARLPFQQVRGASCHWVWPC